MDPVTQALMSQGAASAQQPNMSDPIVQALMGTGRRIIPAEPAAMPPHPSEAGDALAGGALGAIDFMGLPSWAAGQMFGPEAQDAMRGPQERNPGSAMTGAMLSPLNLAVPGAAGGLMRGVGSALTAAPRATGAAAGGLALSSASSTEGIGADGTLQQLYSQRAALAERRDAAIAKRDAEGRTGKGPNWKAADEEAGRLSNELAGLDALIGDEQKRNSPEHRLEMEKKAADLAAEQKAREAATPFRERYPEIAGNLPGVGIALAAGIPFALRGKANLETLLPGSYPSRVSRATQRGEDAISAQDPVAQALARGELDNLIASQPTAMGGAGKAAMAAGSGGLLAAEAGMFPDQYDAFNLPPGPAQEKAQEQALSIEPYLKRGVVGALTGLSGYKAGDLVPSRTANLARAGSVRDFLTGNPSTSEVRERVVTRIVGKDGVPRYQGEGGRWVSPPRRGQ